MSIKIGAEPSADLLQRLIRDLGIALRLVKMRRAARLARELALLDSAGDEGVRRAEVIDYPCATPTLTCAEDADHADASSRAEIR
jgi:hypothetical protein